MFRLTDRRPCFREFASLNMCVRVLGLRTANAEKHVPFRNSKLTFLLQNCFGNAHLRFLPLVLPLQDRHTQHRLSLSPCLTHWCSRAVLGSPQGCGQHSFSRRLPARCLSHVCVALLSLPEVVE